MVNTGVVSTLVCDMYKHFQQNSNHTTTNLLRVREWTCRFLTSAKQELDTQRKSRGKCKSVLRAKRTRYILLTLRMNILQPNAAATTSNSPTSSSQLTSSTISPNCPAVCCALDGCAPSAMAAPHCARWWCPRNFKRCQYQFMNQCQKLT